MVKNYIIYGGGKNGMIMIMLMICCCSMCISFTITCLGGATVIDGKVEEQIDTTEENTIANIKDTEKQNTMSKFLGH